jgi:hypothetical protein
MNFSTPSTETVNLSIVAAFRRETGQTPGTIFGNG